VGVTPQDIMRRFFAAAARQAKFKFESLGLFCRPAATADCNPSGSCAKKQ